jgi:hypothetical protein
MAEVTRDVMGDEDAVPDLVLGNALPDLDDIARDLVPKDPWGLLDAIPFHDIGAADTTGNDLHQELSVPDGRHRPLL